jgi:hypothetical protein
LNKKTANIFKILDIFFVIVILGTLVWALIETYMIRILAPIILAILGVALLFCKKLKDVSNVEKIFFWLSYNIFVPRSERNHLIWGAVLIILGGLSVFFIPGRRDIVEDGVVNRDPFIQDYHDWWYKDPILWIIIILLVIIALYRSRIKKP